MVWKIRYMFPYFYWTLRGIFHWDVSCESLEFIPKRSTQVEVRALTEPLQKAYFLLSRPFTGFTFVLWAAVLLHHSSSVKLQLADRWSYVLLQNALINLIIHFFHQWQQTQGRQSSSKPPGSSIMLYSWDESFYIGVVCLFSSTQSLSNSTSVTSVHTKVCQ